MVIQHGGPAFDSRSENSFIVYSAALAQRLTVAPSEAVQRFLPPASVCSLRFSQARPYRARILPREVGMVIGQPYPPLRSRGIYGPCQAIFRLEVPSLRMLQSLPCDLFSQSPFQLVRGRVES